MRHLPDLTSFRRSLPRFRSGLSNGNALGPPAAETSADQNVRARMIKALDDAVAAGVQP